MDNTSQYYQTLNASCGLISNSAFREIVKQNLEAVRMYSTAVKICEWREAGVDSLQAVLSEGKILSA